MWLVYHATGDRNQLIWKTMNKHELLLVGFHTVMLNQGKHLKTLIFSCLYAWIEGQLIWLTHWSLTIWYLSLTEVEECLSYAKCCDLALKVRAAPEIRNPTSLFLPQRAKLSHSSVPLAHGLASEHHKETQWPLTALSGGVKLKQEIKETQDTLESRRTIQWSGDPVSCHSQLPDPPPIWNPVRVKTGFLRCDPSFRAENYEINTAVYSQCQLLHPVCLVEMD